jgi:hypothetical protein
MREKSCTNVHPTTKDSPRVLLPFRERFRLRLMDSALFALVIIGMAAILFLQLRKGAPVGSEQGEIGRLKAELEQEKAERSKLQGQNKQLYVQTIDLKKDLEHLQKDRDQLQRNLAKHDEAAERHEKESAEKLSRLEKAERSFQEERSRVIREDEAKRQQLSAERDRVWADHEASVIANLSSLCKSPALAFSHYSNNNLPDGFDGSLKPDFMIEFLGQYIIFDAKASKAESLQTYINNTVKETVKKVKKNEKIATTIFLVVPTQAIHELKNHHYPLEGYNLYVICPEALGPILASLKKITAYELAEQLDPQKRENLINLLATMDFQISLQNATNLYLTQAGIDTLEQAQAIDPELWEEAQVKKSAMRIPGFNDLKKLVGSLDAQQEAVSALVAPKVKVKKKDIERAQEAIAERLL